MVHCILNITPKYFQHPSAGRAFDLQLEGSSVELDPQFFMENLASQPCNDWTPTDPLLNEQDFFSSPADNQYGIDMITASPGNSQYHQSRYHTPFLGSSALPKISMTARNATALSFSPMSACDVSSMYTNPSFTAPNTMNCNVLGSYAIQPDCPPPNSLWGLPNPPLPPSYFPEQIFRSDSDSSFNPYSRDASVVSSSNASSGEPLYLEFSTSSTQTESSFSSYANSFKADSNAGASVGAEPFDDGAESEDEAALDGGVTFVHYEVVPRKRSAVSLHGLMPSSSVSNSPQPLETSVTSSLPPTLRRSIAFEATPGYQPQSVLPGPPTTVTADASALTSCHGGRVKNAKSCNSRSHPYRSKDEEEKKLIFSNNVTSLRDTAVDLMHRFSLCAPASPTAAPRQNMGTYNTDKQVLQVSDFDPFAYIAQEEQLNYKCGCGTICKSSKVFRRHVLGHSTIGHVPCCCFISENRIKDYARIDALKRHIRRCENPLKKCINRAKKAEDEQKVFRELLSQYFSAVEHKRDPGEFKDIAIAFAISCRRLVEMSYLDNMKPLAETQRGPLKAFTERVMSMFAGKKRIVKV